MRGERTQWDIVRQVANNSQMLCRIFSRPTSCATLSCRPRLRKVTRMCSRTVSGTAYRFRHGSTLCSPTVEKILCRSTISERSPVSGLRQAKKQRETGVKRVETAGVYPLAPAAGRGESLPLNLSEKHPARSGEPPARLVCPAQPDLKKYRLLGA